MPNISQRNVERRKELFILILSRKTDKELAHLCRRSPGQCMVYAVCPDAKEGPCPFKAMCSDVDESHWSEVRAMVEKKEDNKLKSVEHEDQPKKVEAPFPLIDSSFLDEGIDSYKSLFEENLVEGLARQCNDLNGYNTCPLANDDAPCPFGSSKPCPEITADDWRKLELYVEEKEIQDINNQSEAPDPLIHSCVIDEYLQSYKLLLENTTPFGFARQCSDVRRTARCPLENEKAPCPFGSNKGCSEIIEEDWEKLKSYVLEKTKSSDVNQENMNTVEHEPPKMVNPELSDVNSYIVYENLKSFNSVLINNVSYDNLAKRCNNSSNKILGSCPISHTNHFCPFMSPCEKISSDHWREVGELVANEWENLAMYVKEKEEANMQREANIQREAHTQEINTQEDIVQETKESPVRCYYAFMVKEEKIIFYKGVFTRRKTVPVAFTSESQRDLFVRNYECSYAVSRRQLLHELADAYQDRSITELSRVISEIRRRAISATENSNGAITYSDYLYFDMAEIVFDI